MVDRVSDFITVVIILVLILLISALPAILKLIPIELELRKLKKVDVQAVWDGKTDQQILASYEDATEWIKISQSKYFKSETTESIGVDCQVRLDRLILPQMKRRKLL